MKPIFVKKVTGKSQADGAFTIALGHHDYACHHQIQVEVSATPLAGSLAVEIRSPQASEFVAVDDNVFDLTTGNLIKALSDYAYVAEFRFTPSNFDADKTYNVIVTSGV